MMDHLPVGLPANEVFHSAKVLYQTVGAYDELATQYGSMPEKDEEQLPKALQEAEQFQVCLDGQHGLDPLCETDEPERGTLEVLRSAVGFSPPFL